MTEPQSEQVVDPWTGQVRKKRPLVSFPVKVLWAASAVLALGLLVGFLLSGRWEATRTITIAAPPERIFPLIDSPRGWDAWAPLGDVKSTFSGPEHGAGAQRAWDDPGVGDGVFTIVSAEPDRAVAYRVEVQQGKMKTEGTIALAPAAGGTLVTWHEQGDFGRNPLLGYIAQGMEKRQGAQMEGALRQLAEKAASEK